MKKKFLFGIAASLFAVASVVSFNISNSNNEGDISLDNIAVMAQAQDESPYSAFAKSVSSWWSSYTYNCIPQDCYYSEPVYYTGVGIGVGVSGSYTTGSNYEAKSGSSYPSTTAGLSAGYILTVDVSVTFVTKPGKEDACYGGNTVAHCWECKRCS